MATISLKDGVLNANSLGRVSGHEIDAYQEENGSLVLGLDDNDNPVERPGGHIGNLLILGYSADRPRLENAILRSVSRPRPNWPAPHSVMHQTEAEYAQFLDGLVPNVRKAIEESGETKGFRTQDQTGNATRFVGPEALVNQVLIAHEAMQDNMAQMEKYDLVAPQPEMYHTLHISDLDKLPPQADKSGIYETNNFF